MCSAHFLVLFSHSTHPHLLFISPISDPGLTPPLAHQICFFVCESDSLCVCVWRRKWLKKERECVLVCLHSAAGFLLWELPCMPSKSAELSLKGTLLSLFAIPLTTTPIRVSHSGEELWEGEAPPAASVHVKPPVSKKHAAFSAATLPLFPLRPILIHYNQQTSLTGQQLRQERPSLTTAELQVVLHNSTSCPSDNNSFWRPLTAGCDPSCPIKLTPVLPALPSLKQCEWRGEEVFFFSSILFCTFEEFIIHILQF